MEKSTSAPGESVSGRLRALDSLRGIAALVVFCSPFLMFSGLFPGQDIPSRIARRLATLVVSTLLYIAAERPSIALGRALSRRLVAPTSSSPVSGESWSRASG